MVVGGTMYRPIGSGKKRVDRECEDQQSYLRVIGSLHTVLGRPGLYRITRPFAHRRGCPDKPLGYLALAIPSHGFDANI